jgi:peptide/nickel transport system permease protein
MGRYVLWQLFSCVLLFFAITLFVFVTFFAMPHQRQAGLRARTQAYRLQGSVTTGYVDYVWAIVRHGSLGNSSVDRADVRAKLTRAAPVTLSLLLGGVAVWFALAVPLGLIAALRPRSFLDRAGTVFVLIGLCAHPVWLGLLLSYLFGHYLHVLPPVGYCAIDNASTGCEGLWEWAVHLVLPWITFGMLNAAFFTAMVRALVIEQVGEEYVRTARAKGAGELRVLTRHMYRNISLPIVTMVGLNLGTALGTVVFVESAFDLPGLGGILRQSALRRDLPMTAGTVVFLAVAVMLLNLLIDLAYAVFDPRVRFASSAPPLRV